MSRARRNVCTYGKLPQWEDFPGTDIKYPSGARGWFGRWTSRGSRTEFEAWVRRGRDLAPDAPAAETLFISDHRDASALLCGVIGPSADGVRDSRPWPWAIYLEVARGRDRQAYSLLPLQAADAWTRMVGAWRECRYASSQEDVTSTLERLQVAVPRPGRKVRAWFHAEGSRLGVTEFLDQLHPAGSRAARRSLARLLELMSPFVDGSLGSPTLVFDVATSASLKTAVYQTAFWVHVCRLLLPAFLGNPSLFLQLGLKEGRLRLLPRSPEPGDYPLVLGEAGDERRLRPLDDAGDVTDATSAAVDELLGSVKTMDECFRLDWAGRLGLARP